MALTGNTEINKYAINKFSKQFGENGSFRLVTVDEMNDPNNNPKKAYFLIQMIILSYVTCKNIQQFKK